MYVGITCRHDCRSAHTHPQTCARTLDHRGAPKSHAAFNSPSKSAPLDASRRSCCGACIRMHMNAHKQMHKYAAEIKASRSPCTFMFVLICMLICIQPATFWLCFSATLSSPNRPACVRTCCACVCVCVYVCMYVHECTYTDASHPCLHSYRHKYIQRGVGETEKPREKRKIE